MPYIIYKKSVRNAYDDNNRDGVIGVCKKNEVHGILDRLNTNLEKEGDSPKLKQLKADSENLKKKIADTRAKDLKPDWSECRKLSVECVVALKEAFKLANKENDRQVGIWQKNLNDVQTQIRLEESRSREQRYYSVKVKRIHPGKAEGA